MCRIYGRVSASGPLAEKTRAAVAEWLRPGGPDQQSYAVGVMPCGGNRWDWLLGINRLAITGLDGGVQPYHYPGSGCQAILNGEIYNHEELRQRLCGYAYPDWCDGQTAIPMYLEYGDDFAGRLDGMFAVAVVDGRRKRLVLAADRAGIKPLFYHWDEVTRKLSFASEVEAVVVMSGCGRRVSVDSVDAYLTGKCVYGNGTIYDGVFRLPPGHVMVFDVDRGRPVIRPYAADPADNRDGGIVPSADPAEAARQLAALLGDEVGRLLTMADVPVAAMLSGGLDSTLVAALAARRRPDLHTFHVGYKGNWPGDEAAYAREAARQFGTTHHELLVDPAALPGLIPDVVRRVGANADPITVSSHALFAGVRAAGFKCILTGDGSDELFGGYARMRQAAIDHAGHERWAAAYVGELAAVPADLRRELYTNDVAERVGRAGTTAERLERLVTGAVAAHGGDRLRGLLAFEQEQRLPTYHLARVDTTSCSHGVEARVPFLQRRVVRFSRRLQSGQLIDGDGNVKRLLYAASSGLVPEPILRRPKQPFTLPVAAMLRPGQPLWAFARDVLSPAAVARRGVFRPAAVDRLFDAHATNPVNATGLAVWSLMVLELVCTIQATVIGG